MHRRARHETLKHQANALRLRTLVCDGGEGRRILSSVLTTRASKTRVIGCKGKVGETTLEAKMSRPKSPTRLTEGYSVIETETFALTG